MYIKAEVDGKMAFGGDFLVPPPAVVQGMVT